MSGYRPKQGKYDKTNQHFTIKEYEIAQIGSSWREKLNTFFWEYILMNI